MTQAIISIGLPGCGKSTVLKPMAEKLGYTYLNADDIREELTGDPANHAMEADVWQLVYARAAEGLHYGGVIIDATHTKRKDRREMIEHLRRHGADEIIGLWFDIPYEVCAARNAARGRVVP